MESSRPDIPKWKQGLIWGEPSAWSQTPCIIYSSLRIETCYFHKKMWQADKQWLKYSLFIHDLLLNNSSLLSFSLSQVFSNSNGKKVVLSSLYEGSSSTLQGSHSTIPLPLSKAQTILYGLHQVLKVGFTSLHLLFQAQTISHRKE